MTVLFQNPPAASAGRSAKYMTPEIIAELRQHPGQWALPFPGCPERVRSAVQTWCGRHPDFELTTRNRKADGIDIYVRFTGETL